MYMLTFMENYTRKCCYSSRSTSSSLRLFRWATSTSVWCPMTARTPTRGGCVRRSSSGRETTPAMSGSSPAASEYQESSSKTDDGIICILYNSNCIYPKM